MVKSLNLNEILLLGVNLKALTSCDDVVVVALVCVLKLHLVHCPKANFSYEFNDLPRRYFFVVVVGRPPLSSSPSPPCIYNSLLYVTVHHIADVCIFGVALIFFLFL